MIKIAYAPGGGSCKNYNDFPNQCGDFDNGCDETIHCSCDPGYECDNGTCKPSYTPKTCQNLGVECGKWDNGCGNTINCGSCKKGYECVNGKCEEKEAEDSQAPITSASINSIKWYKSPVLVTLNCYDLQSGCKHTYYCYDKENK